jgi:hypothetical protein
MSCTIIKDPEIEPFFISKDAYCYTVMEVITPDKKNLGRFGNKGNKNEGKNYEKSIGHYSTFSSALRGIAKHKVDFKKEYNSIRSYIKEFEYQKDEMSKLLSKIKI